jgi:hypothetical protein
MPPLRRRTHELREEHGMKISVGVLFAFAACALAGCATMPSPQAARVAEVGAGMVSGCHSLGTVHGSSLVDGVGQSTGVRNAKTEAREQAARWGANAIVWTHVTQRYWGAELVTGDAYKCARNIAGGAS